VYREKCGYQLALGRTPEELLGAATADLKATRDQMVELAAPLSVPQVLDRIARRHATPDRYLAQVRQSLQQATDFVRASGLVALPAATRVEVVETPELMRGTYSVDGFDPAPALEPQLGAFYWVAPIPAGWPRERVESKLREYNYFGVQQLTIHEAMPGRWCSPTTPIGFGRFRGGCCARCTPTDLRAGLGRYAEQMMVDQGYLDGDRALRLTLLKQLLRSIANTILDIRLHTMGMTDQEAMDLMTREAFQDPQEAAAKLLRAKLSSCGLATYYAGFKGWLEVRDSFRHRHRPITRLSRFNERALAKARWRCRRSPGCCSSRCPAGARPGEPRSGRRLSACAAPAPPNGDFTAPALAAQMQRRPIVLLGEVHDNAEQHAVRAQALALLLQAGSRPALAFEQFDRERQADIDRVLGATPAQGVDRAEQLAALGGRGWNWNLYRPFLELALQYRLPIVAANLSRADALRVSKEGFGAVFDAAQQGELRLNPLPADLAADPARGSGRRPLPPDATADAGPRWRARRSRATRHWLRRPPLPGARRRVAGRQRSCAPRRRRAALSVRVAAGTRHQHRADRARYCRRRGAAGCVRRGIYNAGAAAGRPVPVASPQLKGAVCKDARA